MSRKRAFIFGIYGQDGYYLSKLLLEKNYKVFGSFKSSNLEKHAQFNELGVETTYCDIRDEDRVQFLLVNFSPHEVYNLAAESSVIDSWTNPTSCINTNSFGVLNILNVLVNQKNNLADTRFFQASSSEMFGDTGLVPATEVTQMSPGSPYAVSKLLSHQLIDIYRQKYKCFAVSGILFNHESPLRSEKFLSKKIASGVVKILRGLSNEIRLGNMEIRRDWSFAGDTVNAAWSTLQLNSPTDFIIASGVSKTVRDFVDVAFNFVGLKDYEKYVKTDKNLFRSNEALIVQGNPAKARKLLHWIPKYSFENLIELLIEGDLKNFR